MDVTWGTYRLVRILGSGGMGVVHEAWDTRLERRVALKMVHPHLLLAGIASARFEREAKKSARIEHPNVVRVYRVETHDDRLAIEMQFIDGAPLNVLLRSGPLPLDAATSVLRQLLDALRACHEQGVIHCDLKPANVLVTRDGQVFLTDFGIARAIFERTDSEAARDVTTGQLWGTPTYCPPEAWEGGGVSAQWDLYSAGVLVYEAIAGQPAFSGPTPMSLMKAILTETPPPLSTVRPDVSPEFSDLVASLMARQHELRPASARAALERLADTPESRTALSSTVPFPVHGNAPIEVRAAVISTPIPPKTSRRLFAGLVALLLLGILGVAGVMFVPHAEPEQEPAILPETRVDLGPNASDLLLLGGSVFYTADDGVHGRELWTAMGNGKDKLVADIVPGPVSSNPRRLRARANGTFVFAATTPESGEELWIAGDMIGGQVTVEMIQDIIPGPMGSEPVPVATRDNLVLFYATTLLAGSELWCTNAVPGKGQTAMVADLFEGPNGSLLMNPCVYPDADGAFIVALMDVKQGSVLLRYDYATNSLREIADVAEDTRSMATAGSTLLFANSDADYGYEVWGYNTKTGAFGLLADLEPGPNGSRPSQFWSWGSKALFQARTLTDGLELWISDGTADGTAMLKNINPGPNDSDPYGFVAAGDRVFFRAKDDTCGQELWATDGTPAGTARVIDAMPGPDSGNPYDLVANDSSLTFTVNDGEHGEELWRVTQSEAGCSAKLVLDLYPGLSGSEPHQLLWREDNYAFFLAKTPENGMTVCEIYAPPDSDLGVDSAKASLTIHSVGEQSP